MNPQAFEQAMQKRLAKLGAMPVEMGEVERQVLAAIGHAEGTQGHQTGNRRALDGH